jgi:hypothetical protein
MDKVHKPSNSEYVIYMHYSANRQYVLIYNIYSFMSVMYGRVHVNVCTIYTRPLRANDALSYVTHATTAV